MTAIHFVYFEISREKGGFLKTTMWHVGLNGGSIIVCCVNWGNYYFNKTTVSKSVILTYLNRHLLMSTNILIADINALIPAISLAVINM